jgi:two-component system, chemotaxis family, chemotaxis protein CheY
MRSGAKSTTTALGSFQLLLVDNDQRFLKLLRDILLTFGFNKIEFCNDSTSARSLVSVKRFDVILCDWNLMPQNGEAFVKMIRLDEKNPNIFSPIIVLSGRAEREHIEAARDAGATEFLAKPFTLQALRTRIISVIEGPRQFVFTPSFVGPDRRRRKLPPPDGLDRRSS